MESGLFLTYTNEGFALKTLKVYRHGFTCGTAPTKNDHTREKRSTVAGWSQGAARRNTQFLRSVFEPDLHTDDQGNPLRAIALTLTLQKCPATGAHWHKLRRAFLKRCERIGLYRCHWVTEWQRRGVPHLHGAFWFPENVSHWDVLNHWVQAASEHGAQLGAQYALPITDAVGWFKYLSKHAARGVNHYQRSPENVPAGWKGKTGRVWGKTGEWPVREPVALEMDSAAYYSLRRIVRRWRIAHARSDCIRDAVHLARRRDPELRRYDFDRVARLVGAYSSITRARGMLRCTDPKLSSVRGVSDWLPEQSQLQILYHLRSLGHAITC